MKICLDFPSYKYKSIVLFNGVFSAFFIELDKNSFLIQLNGISKLFFMITCMLATNQIKQAL